MSRRVLLTDLGAAGVGLLFLGACAGSSDGASTTATVENDPPVTDPAATDPATTEPAATAAPAATDALADEAPADDEPQPAGLQLQHVSFGFVSAYVLLRGDEAAVVDTGQSASADAILDGLAMLGASWSNVGHVVLTHNHGDHAGGLAGVLEQAPGAVVYAGEADIAGINSSAPLQSIGDGDEVLGMGVFNTPGHTAGSISLFDVDTGILVAGDAINGEDGVLTGANERFSSDLVAAQASIGKMAGLGPQTAAFGHGGPPITTDVAAQLTALASG